VGGWGIPRSRCVYSVGVAWELVAGGVEVVRLVAWRFAAGLILFDGEVLRSLAVEPSSSSRSGFLRLFGCFQSSLDLRWRRIHVMKSKLKTAVSFSTLVAVQGASSSGLRQGFFPAVEDLLHRSKVPLGVVAAARIRPALVAGDVVLQLGPCCILFLLLVLSVISK
jgi:hypothetical protein